MNELGRCVARLTALCLALTALGVGVAVAAGTASAAGPAVSLNGCPEPASPFDRLVAPAPLAVYAAPRPGAGAWYWPVGLETFTMSGWLDPRGSFVHVAQDMPASYGHPVYAIGAGVVWKAMKDAAGYGPGGSRGGVLIIVHTTAQGQQFRALYGHLSNIKYKEGQRVAAGAVIATVNGCSPPHLHFSIHPGTYYRDGNPYAGHVPASWADHGGFVDPVAFLKTHPRVISYRPPPAAVVSVPTATAPHDVGAAAGIAYWKETLAEASTAYRSDLTSGEQRALAPDETVPAFDAARYSISALSAPAIGFAVTDHLPVVGVTFSPVTPRWATAARITALVTNKAGKPFQGAQVRLERRSGSAWVLMLAGATTSDGRISCSYVPAASTAVRARFLPPATQPADNVYLAAVSGAATLTPLVSLSVPSLPTRVTHGATVVVAGVLKPRHTAAAHTVRLVFQRLVGGVWTTAFTSPTTNHDDPAGTRYVRYLSVPTAGSWRVRAVHMADGAHATTVTAWRSFVAR